MTLGWPWHIFNKVNFIHLGLYMGKSWKKSLYKIKVYEHKSPENTPIYFDPIKPHF